MFIVVNSLAIASICLFVFYSILPVILVNKDYHNAQLYSTLYLWYRWLAR